MVNLSHSHYEDRASVFGLARHLMHSLSSALAERRANRQREATLEALQLVEPGLLGEESIVAGYRHRPVATLASMTPAVVAAGVFIQPRR